MTDNMMPELTLEPTAAAEAVPQLTLEPTAPEVPEPEEKKIEPVEMDEKLLTDEEKKAVEDFSHKIDVRDTNMILQYGAAAQKSVAGFSESALNNVRSKDLGEIGQDLSRLVVELKGFGDGEEKKGLMGLFKKAGNRLESMKAQYGKVEANVEKIAQSLEQHQITLLKDVTWNAETAFTTAKAVTIQGSHKIDVTVALSNDTSIKTAFVIQKNGGITLDGVTMNVTTATGNEQKTGRNAAFSITNDAKLALVNGAKLNLTELQTGMYMPGTAPVNATVSVSGEGSAITASDIRGNFSNGGQFTVKDGASLTIDDCGSHGLSANKITVDNAALTVKNTGLCGIITTDTNSAVELKNGATVVVEDCATEEDSSNRAAVDLSQSGATLTVDRTPP